MSSFNPLSTVKFDEDPTANYHDMKVAMETLAGTLCCETYDTGLAELGVHLSDSEYLRQFGVEERPTRERPTQPPNNATKMVYSLYKEAKEDYSKYITAMQTFKTYVVDACKPKIMRGMTTPLMPISAMTIHYIVTELETQYGTPTAHSIQRIQMEIRAPCSSEEEFTTYEHDLMVAFERLAEQRAAYSVVQKMQILTEGTAHLSHIKDIVERYVIDVPRIADRTYDELVERIRITLPNFIMPHMSTAHATTLKPALTAKQLSPVTRDELAQCFAQLTGQLAELSVRIPTNLKQTMITGGPGTATPRTTRTTTTTYCFLHGKDRKHNGMQCRGMGPTSGYTELQRKATAPAYIDGKQGAN